LSVLSLGLKAGLAAGVVYAAMLGIQHLALLETCSSTQIAYIQQQILLQHTNETANDIFSTDLVIFPLYYGILSLILGVIYGVAFSFLYKRLPGSTSRNKGIFIAFPVFVLGILLGISGLEINCDPNWIPYLALAVSLPIAIGFGYILGTFFDSFGRLETEQREGSS